MNEHHKPRRAFLKLSGAALAAAPLLASSRWAAAEKNAAMPLVQAGKLRPLGVTTEKRSPVAPDIPTISEAGLPGYSATSWFSLLAPAATPRDVVMRLNQAIVKGLKSKETIDSFASMNVDVMPLTPEQSADWARNEVAKWAKVVKTAGIQPIEQ